VLLLWMSWMLAGSVTTESTSYCVCIHVRTFHDAAASKSDLLYEQHGCIPDERVHQCHSSLANAVAFHCHHCFRQKVSEGEH
jgi:hypothetical protein